MFIDQARIFVQAGKGGDGACSFRREKFVPYGGPDGGDGGDGGDVIITASHRVTTLLDLKYHPHYEAESGKAGQRAQRHGRSGAPTNITVPVGTIIREEGTDRLLADLTEHDQSVTVAHGGRGGRGNARFATSTNRAPRRHELGTPGESFWLKLELKLLADVGLVGLPNAGKSTFISCVSAAKPEVASYPFTTLRPHLGVVAVDHTRSFVIADIPGLIEGAHEGKGLGIQFLRHIQRTAFLLYLLDCSEWATDEPVQSLSILRRELATYDPDLAKRPFAVVGTKRDIQGDGDRMAALQRHCAEAQIPFFSISAVTREGVDDLIQYLSQQLEARNAPCMTPT